MFLESSLHFVTTIVRVFRPGMVCVSIEICNILNLVCLPVFISLLIEGLPLCRARRHCIRKSHIKINRIHTDWSDHALLTLLLTRNGNGIATFFLLHIVARLFWKIYFQIFFFFFFYKYCSLYIVAYFYCTVFVTCLNNVIIFDHF